MNMFQERAMEEFAKFNAAEIADKQEQQQADIDFALALLGEDEEEVEDDEQ